MSLKINHLLHHSINPIKEFRKKLMEQKKIVALALLVLGSLAAFLLYKMWAKPQVTQAITTIPHPVTANPPPLAFRPHPLLNEEDDVLDDQKPQLVPKKQPQVSLSAAKALEKSKSGETYEFDEIIQLSLLQHKRSHPEEFDEIKVENDYDQWTFEEACEAQDKEVMDAVMRESLRDAGGDEEFVDVFLALMNETDIQKQPSTPSSIS